MVNRVAMLLTATLLSFANFAAAQVVLTFEGLSNLEPVLNFYNGGLGGAGSGPGPNFGITFSGAALAGRDTSVPGGSAAARNEPSPPTVMSFLNNTAVMSVPAGFTTGFSFFYSSATAASIRVYDGVNGTGNLLATVPLVANTPANNCQVVTGVAFCNWSPVGVTFPGIARSVDFGGTANQVGYDNITLGSGTPISTPPPVREVRDVPTLGSAELAMLAVLAAIMGGFMLRRRGA